MLKTIERKLKNFEDYIKSIFTSMNNYIFRYNMSLWHPIRKLEKPQNELIKILEAFPKERWDWGDLVRNPNITLDYIDKHPKLPWRLNYNLSYNPNINIDYVLRHPEINWDWEELSCNPGISLRIIEEYPDLKWNWYYITKHPYLTIEFILNNLNKINFCLGKSQNITMEEIEDHPELNWNDAEITENPNITIDYAIHNIHQDLTKHWYNIGKNIKNFVFNEKYDHLKRNNYFVQGLSENPIMTLDIIKQNKLPIYYNNLCYNPAISMTELQSIKDKYDYGHYMSRNPNVTLEWLIENKKYCAFQELSKNPFKCHPYFDEEIIIRV